VGRGGSSAWIVPGLLLLFVLPLTGFAAYSVADRWYQGYQLAQEEAALRSDIVRLREENLRLQGEIKTVRSDAYVETVAREQLGLVKPGDRAIVLVGPPSSAPPAPVQEPTVRRAEPAERTTPPEPGGWRRLFDAIFGR